MNPKVNPKAFFESLTREQHREFFKTFAQLELDTGGPDPHMAIVGEMSKQRSQAESAWLVACYVIPYTVAGCAVLASYFEPDTLPQVPLENFLSQHWRGLPSRRERRAVWSVRRMSECIRGAANWITSGAFEQLLEAPDYETAWVIANRIPYFGRYATIKFLEGLRRYAGFKHAMPDIRPQGAWSPRRTLSVLTGMPEKAANYVVDAAAEDWLGQIQQVLVGHDLDYFRYETLLCNYRQAIEGKYPGRPHDTELKYWRKAEAYWGRDLPWGKQFYDIRQELFDSQCLGEVNGWGGPRKDLEVTMTQYGYFWSDQLYDYRSTYNLALPVRWP